MSKSITRVGVAAAMGLGLLAMNIGNAAAQANCDWYAKTALRQQQDNEQKKCGFSGPGWSSDLRAHLTWCAAHPDQWKAEAQRREQQLASCKK